MWLGWAWGCVWLAASGASAENRQLNETRFNQLKKLAESDAGMSRSATCGRTFDFTMDKVRRSDSETGTSAEELADYLREADASAEDWEDFLVPALQLGRFFEDWQERLRNACDGPRETRPRCYALRLWLHLRSTQSTDVKIRFLTCEAAFNLVRGLPALNKTLGELDWEDVKKSCDRLALEKKTSSAEVVKVGDGDSRVVCWVDEAAMPRARLLELQSRWPLWLTLTLCVTAWCCLGLGLLGDELVREVMEDLDLPWRLVDWADELGSSKLRDAAILAWAAREDLPESVWDEYWLIYKEFQRCPNTAVAAFNFWRWPLRSKKLILDIGLMEGPEQFNLALLIPYAALVNAGLGSSIQWRGEGKDSRYGTLWGQDTKKILPLDPGCQAEPAAKDDDPRRLRKPKPRPVPNAAREDPTEADETFDNASEVERARTAEREGRDPLLSDPPTQPTQPHTPTTPLRSQNSQPSRPSHKARPEDWSSTPGSPASTSASDTSHSSSHSSDGGGSSSQRL